MGVCLLLVSGWVLLVAVVGFVLVSCLASSWLWLLCCCCCLCWPCGVGFLFGFFCFFVVALCVFGWFGCLPRLIDLEFVSVQRTRWLALHGKFNFLNPSREFSCLYNFVD